MSFLEGFHFSVSVMEPWRGALAAWRAGEVSGEVCTDTCSCLWSRLLFGLWLVPAVLLTLENQEGPLWCRLVSSATTAVTVHLPMPGAT